MIVRERFIRLVGRVARRVLGMLLVAFLISGCGTAKREAPRAPTGRPKLSLEATANADREADGIPNQADAEAVAPSTPAMAPAPAPPPPPPPARPGEAKPEKPEPAADKPHDTSMIIYTARVTMAVYQVDQGLAAVERIARDMGGYLALKRDREITIRVPRGRFDPALAAIDKIGDVLHRDVAAQDVTDEYVDLEIRIKNARAMQARLKQLLERANVKEALEIEKEMRRVTEELELLEGKIKLLKDKIAYSTITVAFEPRGSSIQATKIRLPFPWLSQLGLPNLLQLSEVK